jgi:hypothetical protein
METDNLGMVLSLAALVANGEKNCFSKLWPLLLISWEWLDAPVAQWLARPTPM